MQIHEYSRKYDAFAFEEQRLEIPFRRRFILKAAGKGHRVLDVGCNSGKLAALIAEQNNEVWGLEINTSAAEKAAERGVRVKVANAEDGLPFESGFFDVVHAGSMFEHLYDTEFFAEEILRVLKPGGSLILSFSNLNSLDNRIQVLKGGYISGLGAYPHDQHGDRLRVFNLTKLRELLERAGFEWVEARGVPEESKKNPFLNTAFLMAGKILPQINEVILVKARKSE